MSRFLYIALLFIGCVQPHLEAVKTGKGPCFVDIAKCDISGRYTLEATDLAPLSILSGQLVITQAELPPTIAAVGLSLNFNNVDSYFFKEVETVTWNGDSLYVFMQGQLHSFGTGFPAVGGFSISMQLDAKQKNAVVYYTFSTNEMFFTALDGTVTFSDSSQVLFPNLDTKAKVIFTQL